MSELAATLFGVIVGFVCGFKIDSWIRQTWAVEMIRRLDAKNAEIARLTDDNETYKALLADIRKQIKSQGEWPEIIG